MTYIIGAGTFVTGFNTSDRGIQSVNFSINTNIQRLFHLGYSLPYDENIIVEKQLSITCYGGASDKYSTEANIDCSEDDALTIRIASNACDGTVFEDETDWWVNNYSYSKDVKGWGIETWSLRSRPIVLDQNLSLVTDVEARMIRGIAEGQRTTDGQADTGIDFDPGANIIDDSTLPDFDFIGTLNVRADSIIGRAHDMQYGVVQSVGQATGKSDGKDGNGSARIPYQIIYLPT